MKIGTHVLITDGLAKGLTGIVVEDNLNIGMPSPVVRIDNPSQVMLDALPTEPPTAITAGVKAFYPDSTKTNVKAWIPTFALKEAKVA